MRVDGNHVLEVVRNGRAVVEELALDEAGDERGAADTEQNVLLVGEDLDRLIAIAQNALDLAQGKRPGTTNFMSPDIPSMVSRRTERR